MRRFLLKRLGESAIAVLGVLTLVFVITRLLGDPVSVLLPLDAPADVVAQLRRELGLDRPILQQFLTYMGDVLRGDFGISFVYNRPAALVILERIPATLLLAVIGASVGLVVGCLIGLAAALWRGTVIELAAMFFALVAQATPTFWLALMAIMLFSVQLNWLPTSGRGGWEHMVMPCSMIAIYFAANVTRVFRSSLLDVMDEDYIRTARAKGLRPARILTWHMIRNALIPVVTMSGLVLADLLGGSVVVETIFGWPGVGTALLNAANSRDLPVIQAGVILTTILYLLVNTCVDLLYGALDPRVRDRRTH